MILINYITFDVYDRLGSYMEMEQRNLTYEQQLNLCNKQAAERESAYQDTRRIRHDINSYLLDLKAALQAGNVEDAKAKIEHLLEQNRIYRNEISTSGNLVIDSLINYKYSLARKEGIRMECQIEEGKHFYPKICLIALFIVIAAVVLSVSGDLSKLFLIADTCLLAALSKLSEKISRC